MPERPGTRRRAAVQRGRRPQGRAPRRPRQGRKPEAAGRSRRRQAAGPFRRRPRWRRRAVARRWRPARRLILRPTRAAEQQEVLRWGQPIVLQCPPGERSSAPSCPGSRRARDWLVSKLTVRATAGWGAPAAARSSAAPGGAQSQRFGQRSGPRLFGKRRFCGVHGVSRGARPAPGLRPRGRGRREVRRAERAPATAFACCPLSQQTILSWLACRPGPEVHHGARKIARLVHTTSSSGRRPAS